MAFNHDQLMAMLTNNEDNFVERKPESLKHADIRKSVVAFANSVPEGRFAVLFIGIRDDGSITGCQNPDAKQKLVQTICGQDCYPPIAITSEVLNTGAGDVVAVVIGPSKNRPHFAGPAFVRQGSKSVAASAEIFRELLYAYNDKVAAILRLKGQVVSFISLCHKIGEVSRIADNNYREGGTCRVLECDAQRARLQRADGDMRHFSEPVEHIKVLHDEEHHRPMLVFSGY